MASPSIAHLHTTLCIRDLDQARAFYGELLGLTELTDRPLSFPGLWYDLGNAHLHLIVDVNYQAPASHTNKWGRGPHLALYIPNLDLMRETLENRAIAYQASASGRPAIFVRDPDQNTIELCQISPV